MQDGSTAVLGGLIQDQLEVGNSAVPVLGRLPVIGALFRSESRSRKKTNLMVFLRPVILRDNSSMDRLSLDRYDMMRTLQTIGQPEPSSVMPINSGPILPIEPNSAPLSTNGSAPVPQPLVRPFDPPAPAPAPDLTPMRRSTPAAPAADPFFRSEMP